VQAAGGMKPLLPNQIAGPIGRREEARTPKVAKSKGNQGGSPAG